MSVGSRIRFYRDAAGMTQRQLCRRLRMAPSQLSRYENGLTRPGLEVLCRVARALDVRIADLVVGD